MLVDHRVPHHAGDEGSLAASVLRPQKTRSTWQRRLQPETYSHA